MRQEHIIIRRERPRDYAAVEHLTREAFWNVYRPGCLEHYVVHVLRKDPDFVPQLALLMERDGLTEEQAHRTLQKRSMDQGLTLVQTARRTLAQGGG